MKKRFLWCAMLAVGSALLLSGCGKVGYYVSGGPWRWSRSKGRCDGNLKQLNVCIQMYMDDNQGAMPSMEDLVRGQYITENASFAYCEFPMPWFRSGRCHYEFMIPRGTNTRAPEFLDGRSPSQIEMVRCPIHLKHACLGGNVN